jgi:hypothetical protein
VDVLSPVCAQPRSQGSSQGLKPHRGRVDSARLKPCPDTKRFRIGVGSGFGTAKDVPDTKQLWCACPPSKSSTNVLASRGCPMFAPACVGSGIRGRSPHRRFFEGLVKAFEKTISGPRTLVRNVGHPSGLLGNLVTDETDSSGVFISETSRARIKRLDKRKSAWHDGRESAFHESRELRRAEPG